MTIEQSVSRIAWKILETERDRNSLVSPLGLYVILEELASGTGPDSESGRALRTLLGYAGPDGDGILGSISKSFGDYWSHESFDCSNLAVLNEHSDAPLADAFFKGLSETYGAEIAREDLTESLEAARKKVSEWIAAITAGQIPDYKPVFDSGTDLALFNVLHLKSKWEDGRFYPGTRMFRDSKGNESEVATLEKGFFDLQYHDDSSFKGVFIPLQADGPGEGRGGLAVIMPSDGGCDGPERWYSQGDAYRDGFIGALIGSPGRNVDVSFPRFRMSAGHDLMDMLNALGVGKTLSEHGLDMIFEDRPAYVVSGKQESVLDVGEHGLEASAVTEACICTGCAPPPDPPLVFECDVPFIVAVCDGETGLVAFAGHVCSP